MSKGEFDGKWRQARDPAKEWWDQLTSDSVETVSTQRDKFVGLIQEKYGLPRKNAEQEFDRRMAEYQVSRRKSGAVRGAG